MRKSKRNRAAIVVAAAVATFALAARAQAQNAIYWEGDAGTNWLSVDPDPAIGTNWSQDPDGAGNAFPFSDKICTFSKFTGAANFDTQLTSNLSIRGLHIFTGHPNISVTLHGSLSVGQPGVFNSLTGALDFLNGGSGSLTSSTSTLTMDQAAGGTTRVWCPITGAGVGLTKAGPGILELRGAATYAGPTNIDQGLLAIVNDGTISPASTITVNNTGTLRFNRNNTWGSHQTTNTAPIVINAGGQVTNGTGRYTSLMDVTFAGGTLVCNEGVAFDFPSYAIKNSITVNGSGQSTVSDGTGDVAKRAIAIGPTSAAGATTVNVTNAAGSLLVNVPLINNRNDDDNATLANGLTKTGPGTLTLAAVSTYTGGTTVDAGTLQLTTTGALTSQGIIRGAVTINSGATVTASADAGGWGLGYGNTGDSVTAITINGGTLTFGGPTNNGTVASIINMTGGTISGSSFDWFNGITSTPTLNTFASSSPATISSALSLRLGGLGTTNAVTFNVADGAAATDLLLSGGITSGHFGGDGAVTKTGAGVMVLDGTSTYTGGTTISAGTLQIGNGGTNGSVTGDIASSAALVFNRSDNSTYGGSISLTGTVTKLGAGTLTLAAANTYIGGTTISAGTLQIGNGGTTGSIAGDVVNNGVLRFNRSNAVAFSGNISGTGAVLNVGAGTLTLGGTVTGGVGAAPNASVIITGTASGGALPADGTVRIGNGGTSGMVIGDLYADGLYFDRSDSFTVTGRLRNSSIWTEDQTVTKLGGGTVTLTDPVVTYSPHLLDGDIHVGWRTTFIISAGAIQVGNGGAIPNAFNAFDCFVQNSAALIFNHSNDFGVSDVISGSGSLTKAGSGVLTMNPLVVDDVVQTSTYTGATNLAGGVLALGALTPLGNGGPITFTGGTLRYNADASATDYSARIAGSTSSISIDTNGRNIAFASSLAASNTGGLTKLGAGTLTLTAANSYTGGTSVQAGKLALASNLTSSSSISVTGGTLELSEGGGSNRVIKTQSVSVTGSGKIDLKDNKLITQSPIGTWNGTNYTGVQGLVQAGRNPETGVWDGSGIVTSMTDATTGVLTTLAVATGAELRGLGPTDTDLFAGQTINGDSTIVMYTWGGDADLNGELNGDDYFFLDSNVLQSGTVFGYHQGDFDYNGELNGDDYFILDSNILQAQGSGIIWPTGAGGSGLSAIPEPGSVVALVALTIPLSRKRRRRRG